MGSLGLPMKSCSYRHGSDDDLEPKDRTLPNSAILMFEHPPATRLSRSNDISRRQVAMTICRITDQHSLAGADDQRSNHKDSRGPGPLQCSVS